MDRTTRSNVKTDPGLAAKLTEVEALITRQSERFRALIEVGNGLSLARDVDSPIDVPAHDNSAMDGWAVRAEDLVTDRETELFAVGTAYAGVAFPGRVEPGRAVRVMTGAVMPEGTDTPQRIRRGIARS
jgi:molybdopterin biosynthesis enzyme